jgi:hypothetical protein
MYWVNRNVESVKRIVSLLKILGSSQKKHLKLLNLDATKIRKILTAFSTIKRRGLIPVEFPMLNVLFNVEQVSFSKNPL